MIIFNISVNITECSFRKQYITHWMKTIKLSKHLEKIDKHSIISSIYLFRINLITPILPLLPIFFFTLVTYLRYNTRVQTNDQLPHDKGREYSRRHLYCQFIYTL